MTLSELAKELGVSIQRLNQLAHELFPRGEHDRYARWRLSQEQAQRLRDRVARRAEPIIRSGPSPKLAVDEWFWEGNVQASIAAHLVREGWHLVRVADTGSKERGDDIFAIRDGRELVVEVKGYPSASYADPARAGELKSTSATLQAHHWLADAVLKSLRTLNKRPGIEMAIGVPRLPRYEHLIDEVEPSLRRLTIGVYFVDEDGTVTEIREDRPFDK